MLDADGRELHKTEFEDVKIFSPETTSMVSRLLENLMTEGTASRSRSLGWTRPAGGKTGTTDDFKDAWFVGYTSSITCGVWVGLDDPKTIMARGYGSTLALPLWVNFMNKATGDEFPAAELKPAVPLARTQLCAVSGRRASTLCASHGVAYEDALPKKNIPEALCSMHRRLASQPAPSDVRPVPRPVSFDTAQQSRTAEATSPVSSVVPPGWEIINSQEKTANPEPTPEPVSTTVPRAVEQREVVYAGEIQDAGAEEVTVRRAEPVETMPVRRAIPIE